MKPVIVLTASAVLVAACAPLNAHGGSAPAARAEVGKLPSPVPQPVTHTGAGPQVAWLWVQGAGQQPSLVAYDPSGRRVGRLGGPTASGMAAVYGFWRSPDGGTVLVAGGDSVASYSALDGSPVRTYVRPAGFVVGDAFSPEGRWLALLLLGAGGLHVDLIDLQGGGSQVLPVAHDPAARLPGMSGPPDSVAWGLAVFAPDAAHLYTLTDWGGPTRLTAFSLAGGRLVEQATAVDGRAGRHFPGCAGPAMAARVVGAGGTLVAFCHFDGTVWFFDLRTLDLAGVVRAKQANPFWLSPIFTPDGRLLYLHQGPGFGDSMQVVDLATRSLLSPVPTPTRLDQGGPFAGLVPDAYAGGVASTVPVSPDGLTLYSATDDGVMALRVPDLEPVAQLARGVECDEVWVSGDGRTLYITAGAGQRLLAMRADGSQLHAVPLPAPAGGFVAADHG